LLYKNRHHYKWVLLLCLALQSRKRERGRPEQRKKQQETEFIELFHFQFLFFYFHWFWGEVQFVQLTTCISERDATCAKMADLSRVTCYLKKIYCCAYTSRYPSRFSFKRTSSKHLFDVFLIQNDLQQGDALS
jgi:hypothetical protein